MMLDRESAEAEAGPCVSALAGLPEGTLVVVGTATYAGEPAYVLVFERTDGSTAVVVRAADCTELTTVELDR
jgi:hypothetical protein